MSATDNPLLQHELRRVATPEGLDRETRVYVLLPDLDELLGVPGFGRRDPICLPGSQRPLDGWALFGSGRDQGWALH